ncbi:LysR substrate binding domain-containing protein, partial [Acetitomaculum ruminis DSM 5522]
GEKDGFFSNFYEFVEQDKVFEAIKDDMADCGIIMSMGEILDYWSFPLLKIPAHVFLNKNHPLAKNEKVTIKEITDYPVICDGNIKDFYRSVYEVKKADKKQFQYIIEPTMLKASVYLCGHKDAILLGNLIENWSNYYDSIIALPLEDVSWKLSIIGKKDNIHKEDCFEFGKCIKNHIIPTVGLKYALMENSKEFI